LLKEFDMVKESKPLYSYTRNKVADGSLYGIAGTALEGEKKKLLLHACCGPCATSCVERTAYDYSVTVYYYNPNIMDEEEYLKRRDALLKFLKAFNEENKDVTYVDFIEGKFEPDKFVRRAHAFKDEPEGGRRCDVCFEMRLSETARMAREMNSDYFTTTMSVSPHKDYDKIRELGMALTAPPGPEFLDIDFKKKNGFGRSVELSKKYGLYRQDFCGCEFAREHDKKERTRDE
jgi:predicted adenine nucleotide alpha hydrolase (AANH) superfamily ATPase